MPGFEPGLVRAGQISGAWRRETTEQSRGHSQRIVRRQELSHRIRRKVQERGRDQELRSRNAVHVPGTGELVWDLRLKNTTGVLLEIGELAFPLLVNDDYGAYGTQGSDVLPNTAARQRNIHEQKVLAHHYIGGHSSYSFLQRPMGTPPFLLIQPLEDTAFECMYKASGQPGGGIRGGPICWRSTLCGARPETAGRCPG